MGTKPEGAVGRQETFMSFATGLKTIVVATDLDGRSGAALEYARKLAGAYGARVVLAHGLDPMEYAAVDAIPGQVLTGLTEKARAVLDELASGLLQEGIPSHSEIRQGAIASMLVDVARQYCAGLIVVGTQGLGGAGPVIVGAIAEQLVRLAPCPVLAVAADWNAGDFRPVPGGLVMLAVERNEAMQAAADTACSLAQTFHRTLLMVHARGADQASAALDPCDTSAEEFGVTPSELLPVRCMVKDGSPADVVVEAIEECHPSMLVVGVKRASETPGPHGTAFDLLARSKVPVLCVPPDPEACRPVENC
jgi:nucleotide-binding universal stress UspA family protein